MLRILVIILLVYLFTSVGCVTVPPDSSELDRTVLVDFFRDVLQERPTAGEYELGEGAGYLLSSDRLLVTVHQLTEPDEFRQTGWLWLNRKHVVSYVVESASLVDDVAVVVISPPVPWSGPPVIPLDGPPKDESRVAIVSPSITPEVPPGNRIRVGIRYGRVFRRAHKVDNPPPPEPRQDVSHDEATDEFWVDEDGIQTGGTPGSSGSPIFVQTGEGWRFFGVLTASQPWRDVVDGKNFRDWHRLLGVPPENMLSPINMPISEPHGVIAQ